MYIYNILLYIYINIIYYYTYMRTQEQLEEGRKNAAESASGLTRRGGIKRSQSAEASPRSRGIRMLTYADVCGRMLTYADVWGLKRALSLLKLRLARVVLALTEP